MEGMLGAIVGAFIAMAVLYTFTQLALWLVLKDPRARKITACCIAVPLAIVLYAWGTYGDGVPLRDRAVGFVLYVGSGLLLLGLDLARLRRLAKPGPTARRPNDPRN